MVLGYLDFSDQIAASRVMVAFTYCSLTMLYLSGMADDLVGIRYSAKFVIQILCGILMIGGGLWLSDFHGALFIGQIPAWIGYPFTVLLAVFIINAFNLIDGIDGLASGLSSMACLFFGIVFFLLGEYLFSMLASAT
ncbi:LPS biosynthesis related glycosyltransferase, partial [gut metagenome]